MTDWFDRAFGARYLRLYAHRDAGEAEQLLHLLEPWVTGVRVLDVGCGAGRHVAVLRRRGVDVLGLDRSAPLLAEAARVLGGPAFLVRADMRRLPVRDGAFGAVLSLFTSFGYFETADDHRALLAGLRRAVADGGVLVLDYLNAPRVRRTLVARSGRRVDDLVARETRRIERAGAHERIVKELTLHDDDGTLVETYEERVLLLDRAPLEGLLEEAGWRTERVFGDYAGGPWSEDADRLLLVARGGPRR